MIKDYKILRPVDKKYPKRLKCIKNPPELYVIGDINILNKDSIAIIGSRNSSEYGERMAEKFTSELTNKGLCIVSGLAIGIDTIAHYSCIKNGGKTIAVLGSGFNYVYPEENKELCNLILETGGVIVSEYPPDTKVKKSNFPTRNRIVSGLCLGTLVIESSYRSGTSITANKTIEQGKPVFCVPNSIGNKNSSGTINLILKGAKLVKNADNIINSLPQLENKIKVKVPLILSEQGKNMLLMYENMLEKAKNINSEIEFINKKIHVSEYIEQAQNEVQIKIIKYIYENKIVTCDELSKVLDINIQQVNCELTNLEILGTIQLLAGGKIELRRIDG